jgi:hypothetical protein
VKASRKTKRGEAISHISFEMKQINKYGHMNKFLFALVENPTMLLDDGQCA